MVYSVKESNVVQPANYAINVQSPLQAFGQAAQFGAGLAEMDARRQAQQQEAVRQQALNTEFQRISAIQNPQASDYTSLSLLLPPAQMESIRKTYELGSQEQKDNQILFSGKVLAAFTNGQNQIGIDLLENRATAEENSGRKEQGQAFRSYAELARLNPGAAKATIGMLLATVPGGDKILEATTKAQLAPFQVAEAQAKETARLNPVAPTPGFTLLTPAQNKAMGLPEDVIFQQSRDGQITELKISAKPKEKENFRVLTKEEKVSLGLAENEPYQIGPNGEVKKIGTGPLVNVNTQESIEDQIRSKIDIPSVQSFTAAATSARGVARDTQIITELLRNKSGGAVVKLTTELAKNLGFSTETVTANDLANALATKAAVQVRPAGSGSTSDIEFKAFVSSIPSLANSEGGRELMNKYSEAFAKRSAKLADHARKLLRTNKFSDEEMNKFDSDLGPLLGADFNNFLKGKRPGVQQYQPPAITPKASPPPAAAPPAARPASGVKFLGFE